MAGTRRQTGARLEGSQDDGAAASANRAPRRSASPPSATTTGEDSAIQTDRMSHCDVQTFLLHPFGRGPDDSRCVVEKYRSHPGGEIEPVQAKDERGAGRTLGRRCRGAGRPRGHALEWTKEGLRES